MTSERNLIETANTYIGRLGAVAHRHTEPNPDMTSRLEHIAWMCTQIPVHLQNGKEKKAQRWMGFIQGFLWSHGYYQIDELRDHNRS